MKRLACVVIVGGFLLALCPAPQEAAPPPPPTPPGSAAERDIPSAVEHDKDGRIRSVPDAAGRTTANNYDLDEHRLVRKMTRELPDHTRVVVEFDGAGPRKTMTDALGTVRYTPDAF